jgi:NADH-quinone oxidoreductase chain I
MITAFIQGLAITMRHFFKKPITLRYPKQKRRPYPRFRGIQRLQRNEQGRLKCVACCLCATVCPAQVITVEGGENPDGQKFPKVFRIDIGRCIFCGYCEQACPMDAIHMTGGYELAEYDKENLLYDRERLMK